MSSFSDNAEHGCPPPPSNVCVHVAVNLPAVSRAQVLKQDQTDDFEAGSAVMSAISCLDAFHKPQHVRLPNQGGVHQSSALSALVLPGALTYDFACKSRQDRCQLCQRVAGTGRQPQALRGTCGRVLEAWIHCNRLCARPALMRQ